MPIPFTQYLMPNGRKTRVFIALDPETEAKAERILEAGYEFEIEMLSDHVTISMTIYDPELDQDIAAEICENGPQVPISVKKLISEFEL